jgi:hypothetical protein
MTAQSATMDHMSGGLGRQNGNPAGEPDPNAGDAAAGFHFCCICGAQLGFDFEDEIDGEGAGRDICGDCNRTKNDEALFGR